MDIKLVEKIQKYLNVPVAFIFLLLSFIPTSYGIGTYIAKENKVFAGTNGPVPGDDCEARWYSGYPDNGDGVANDYDCYIRGIFSTAANPGYTHKITYPSGVYFNFITGNPAHTAYNNQEVIFLVRYTNSFGGFNIVSPQSAGYYNTTPVSPVQNRPQSLWDLGPKNNATYAAQNVTCNTTGTAQGCSVQFSVTINDPDYYNYLRTEIDVTSNLGGDKSYDLLVGNGTNNKTITLQDGIWTWRARSCDSYVCSGWNTKNNIKVDTTAPGYPALPTMQAEPEFSASTQNNVVSDVLTDNLIGGVQYQFDLSTDPTFATTTDTSGFVNASNWTFAGLTDGQTYYYRVKARDALYNESSWSNAISSIQDATYPVVSNIIQTDARISPINADGINDTTIVSYDYSELNPKEAKIEIEDENGDTVKSYIVDLTVPTPPTSISYLWDGTSDLTGTYAADGVYTFKLIVSDKAGNETIDANTYVIVDNDPADVNISQPANGSWFNTPDIDISGQIDADGYSLEITNTTNGDTVFIDEATLQSASVPYAFLSNLTIDEGLNNFTFKTVDIVGNTQTVGFDYYREDVVPQITSLLPSSQINDTTPEIVINLTDFGFNDGVTDYISGINTSSVFISLMHPDIGELVLVNNGINTQTALGNIVETCSQAGTIGLSTVATCQYKFVFNNNLTPNGNYTIKAYASDNAENFSGEYTEEFELDSFTQNDVATPTNGQLFNYSLITLTGTAEKNSQITVSVPDVNGDLSSDSEIFNIIENDPTNSTRIEITNCRASAAPTQDGIKEICDWTLTDFQLERDAVNNVNISNPITVALVDNYTNQSDSTIRNIDTKVITVDVNLFAVSLSVNADLEYFSPNGDGKQDGINFIDIATDGVIDTYELRIEDLSGNIVKKFTANGQPPTNIPWDGRDESGTYLTDGEYKYYLHVITTDGIEFNTTPQSIFAVTQLTDQVIITYPKNDSYSSRGVTTVQGQAPANTTVRICDDVVGVGGDCDFEYYSPVDSYGSFSTIIPLFRLDGVNVTQHFLKAKAIDKYNNETPDSNSVKISVTTLTPFNGVEILPALTGVNNEADYQIIVDKLNNNEEITQADIDSLRSVILRAKVNQGTERVRLAYADHTNLNALPPSTQFENIGYIDGLNQTELYENYTDGVNPINLCNLTECVWDFVYPVPPVGGGIYEIEFEGKLDVEIQKITAALLIDGNIPMAPIILDVDKILIGVQSNTNIFENKYYSNSEIIQIKGASDPNAQIDIYDQNSNLLCSVTASGIGFWTCNVDASTIYPNINIQPVELNLNVIATLNANSTPSIEDKTVVIDKVAPEFLNVRTSSIWKQSGNIADLDIDTNEALGYAKNTDTDPFVIPNKCINALAVNQFGQFVQNGKIDDLNIKTNGLGAVGSFTIPGTAVEGKYCTTLEIQDRAGNRNTTPTTFFIDNTDPDIPIIDTTLWGLYNGINTQPGFIAQGRLVPGFTHEEKTTNIFGYSEEGLPVEIFVNGQKIGETRAYNRNDNLNGQPVCISKLDASGNQIGDKIIDGVMTKSGMNCLYMFSYQFAAEVGYNFQVKTYDYALNKSVVSEDETIYYDITPPRRPETISVDKSTGPIVDWTYARNEDVTAAALGTGNFGKIPISNSKDITVKDFAEALSDMIYSAYGPGFNPIAQDYKLKDGDGIDERNYNLNLGDGIYTFTALSVDAPGNQSQNHLFQIELDTVAPGRPGVSLSLAGGSRPTGITMFVQGEPGGYPSAARSIKLSSNGTTSFTIKSLSIYNDADWERTFTFCSGVYDRAGNLSESACDSVTTPVRPTRPGECNFTDSMKSEFNEIAVGNQTVPEGANILEELGFSKSCQVYESSNIQSSLKSAQDDLTKIQEEATSCLQNKLGEGKDYDTAANECNLNSKLGKQTTDAIRTDLNNKQNAGNCVQKKLEEGKKSEEAFSECNATSVLGEETVKDYKKQLEEHDKNMDKQREEDKKPGWQKFVEGIGNGIKSVGEGLWNLGKGIVDFVGNTIKAGISLTANAAIAITSLADTAINGGDFGDNFNKNKEALNKAAPFIPVNNPIDDLKQIGAAVAVGAVIALAVIAAPIVGPALAAMAAPLAAVGGAITTGIAGTMTAVGVSAGLATTIASGITFAGGALLANTVMTVGGAVVQTAMQGDWNNLGKNMVSGFCGDSNPKPSLESCAGYTLGSTFTGEAIGLGIGKALGKVGTVSDDIAKNASKLSDDIADVSKISDDIVDLSKISDDVTDLTKSLDKVDNIVDDLSKNADLADDVSDAGKINLDDFKLDKASSSKYRSDLTDAISDNPPTNLKNTLKEYPDFPKGLDANHRIPEKIAKQYPDAVADAMNKLGIKDLNDPKLMEYMTHGDNVTHYHEWKKLVDATDNIDGDKILEIFKNVEKNINYKNPGIIVRPIDGIDIINF
jgi:flagellar hook assembly protein FlgD